MSGGTADTAPIQPGAMLGVLGGGQLGRMFTQAAQRMGYRVAVLTPEADTPTAQIADKVVLAEYGDEDAVRELASGVAAVTFEFENIPSAVTAAAAEIAPVRPGGELLHMTQDRLRERALLQRLGLPCAPHAPVRTAEDLAAAVAQVGAPAILKTASWGYDGKGQRRIDDPAEAAAAWRELGEVEVVYEGLVPFVAEVSVVAARSLNGSIACYPLLENEHRNHILDVTLCPAPVLAQHPGLDDTARDIATTLLKGMQVVGVLCVEMFLLADGNLVVNEIAPRPHNSGHLTIEAHATSQFEQQVRAVCGLPLGSTELLRPAAMANLLGDVWANGPPDFPAALAVEGSHLHLYGKKNARDGRKMGHITVRAASAAQAGQLARESRRRLTGGKQPR